MRDIPTKRRVARMQGNEFGSTPLELIPMTTIETDDASRESSCAMMLPSDLTSSDREISSHERLNSASSSVTLQPRAF